MNVWLTKTITTARSRVIETEAAAGMYTIDEICFCFASGITV